LFTTRTEALASHSLQWALANLILFLFPSLILATYTIGAQLGFQNHDTPRQLADFLAYFSFWAGSASIFTGKSFYIYFTDRLIGLPASMIFPQFFRYHLAVPLILGRRRHRSHFSFKSQRRLHRVCVKSVFTIFVLGLNHRSLPLRKSFFLVRYPESTSHNRYRQNYDTRDLSAPRQFRSSAGSTICRFCTSWSPNIVGGYNMESLGIGLLSDLHLRFLFLVVQTRVRAIILSACDVLTSFSM
jgi:hypothetical protein